MKKQFFLQGFYKTMPFQPGVIPFGVLYGTIGVSAGLPWWLVLLFSIIVFAGSSQLVFIDLYSHLGSGLQAVLGSNIVNSRHLIYSAGVSPEFTRFSTRWRVILSYLLTDQLYALVESQKDKTDHIPVEVKPWFYLGSGFCTWAFWFAATSIGIFFGQLIPKDWNLDFAVPLMFMPMLISVCKNRFAVLVSLLAIIFLFLFQSFPFGLGIFFAIICASVVGYFVEKTWRKT